MKNNFRRGDIVYCDLSVGMVGSEQGGIRPCVIVQNDVGNEKSTTTVIVPISSKRKPLHTHLLLSNKCFKHESFALCEQVRVVDEMRLKGKIGECSTREIAEINMRLKMELGL